MVFPTEGKDVFPRIWGCSPGAGWFPRRGLRWKPGVTPEGYPRLIWHLFSYPGGVGWGWVRCNPFGVEFIGAGGPGVPRRGYPRFSSASPIPGMGLRREDGSGGVGCNPFGVEFTGAGWPGVPRRGYPRFSSASPVPGMGLRQRGGFPGSRMFARSGVVSPEGIEVEAGGNPGGVPSVDLALIWLPRRGCTGGNKKGLRRQPFFGGGED